MPLMQHSAPEWRWHHQHKARTVQDATQIYNKVCRPPKHEGFATGVLLSTTMFVFCLFAWRRRGAKGQHLTLARTPPTVHGRACGNEIPDLISHHSHLFHEWTLYRNCTTLLLLLCAHLHTYVHIHTHTHICIGQQPRRKVHFTSANVICTHRKSLPYLLISHGSLSLHLYIAYFLLFAFSEHLFELSNCPHFIRDWWCLS